MSDPYKLGNSVRLRAVFRDVDGELTDPAIVVCMVKGPDGVETSYTYGTDPVVRDEAGTYHFWLDADQSGTWAYRWKGLDAQDVANESTFDVDESEFTIP